MPRYLSFAAAVALVLAGRQPLAAQMWPSQLTNTPTLVQDGFGSGGFFLPNDGLEYCVPTSTSMSILYLGNAGFHQLAPANATTAQQLNLVRIMGGLMQTTPGGGTNTNNKVLGVANYFAAAGLGSPTSINYNGSSITSISNSNYTLNVIENPTVAEMNTFYQPPLQTGQITVGQLGIGWFKSTDGGSTFSRTGGHGITLLGVQNVASQQIIVNNPLPHSIAPVPDLPAFVTQYAQMGPHTGTLVGVNGNPIVIQNTQYGFDLPSTSQAVIQLAVQMTISATQLPSNNPVILPWSINGVQTINTNGGNLNVIAPLQDGMSPGGFTKSGAGVLTLSNSLATTTTGAWSVQAGTLLTTNATTAPLGSGAVAINAGSLVLAPDTTAPLAQTLASGPGNQLSYGGGGTLTLTPATGQNLTVTFGGNATGNTGNLVRAGSGTLAIELSAGIGQLGVTTFFKSAGQGSNLPQLTNGIVAPSMVGQDTATSSASGDFLTYHANGGGQTTTGFGVAAYTSSNSTPINSPSINSTTVYAAESNQTVASGGTVSMHALKVGTSTSGPVTIASGGGTTTINVGPQAPGQAGVILNGGAISTTALQFGAAEALVFSSLAGGTIASQVQGTGGLTKFGPGRLTLSGANSYTGPTTVQSGTLAVTGSLGVAPSPTPVTVNTGGTLEIAGPIGVVNGSATARDGGRITLFNGTLGAPAGGGFPDAILNVDAVSTIQGNGAVNAAATINGFIGPGATPGTMTFTGPVTFSGSTFINWKLFEQADDNSPNPNGRPWNDLNFTGPGADLMLGDAGMGNEFHVVLDLTAIPDPNSGDAFWNAAHHWTLMTLTHDPHRIGHALSAGAYIQGQFSLSFSSSTGLVLSYAPVPEPSAFFFMGSAIIGAIPIVRRASARRG